MVLQGKKVIITGGSSGIGKATAKKFLEEGAEVCLVSNTTPDLEKTREELSKIGKVSAEAIDVSNPEDANAFALKIKSRWETVNVLINCAGIYGPIGIVTEADPGAWLDAIKVNLFGTFLMIHGISPLMKERGGVIINLVGGGEGAYPNFSSYVSGKGGVARLTETVAVELAPWNIRINAIAPGAVNTKFLDDLLAVGPEKSGKENYERALKQKAEGGTPPEKAADLCVFLASEASLGLTGKIISAVWDDYAKFPERLEKIMSTDIYNFRRVRPKDRGFDWEEKKQ